MLLLSFLPGGNRHRHLQRMGRPQKTMPAVIPIAAAPVAPHGTACRHGSSGVGPSVGGSAPGGGVCFFSRYPLVRNPPAGPSGVPSRVLQSSLSPRAPGGGSVRCAPPLPDCSCSGKAALALHGNALRVFAPLGIRLRRALRSCAPGVSLVFARSLPPDHSVRGGSGRGTQATVAAFPFPHPPPLPSSVKRLPAAGSRRVLAPVMPPAMWTAGVPPAAPPRPLIVKDFPARPCRHSRQASAPRGFRTCLGAPAPFRPGGAPASSHPH